MTNSARKVTYVTSYFTSELLWKSSELVGQNENVIFTPSSKMFFQSYLVSTLLHDDFCKEMHLVISNAQDIHIPITVNSGSDDDSSID